MKLLLILTLALSSCATKNTQIDIDWNEIPPAPIIDINLLT